MGSRHSQIDQHMKVFHQQLIGSLSHYLQGFIYPKWLAGFLPSTYYVNKYPFIPVK